MKRMLLLLVLCSYGLFGLSKATESDQETKAVLTIHNVGQGQCHEVELYDTNKNRTKSLLIGFGIEEIPVAAKEFTSVSKSRSKLRLTAKDFKPSQSFTPLTSQELIRELRSKYRHIQDRGIDIDHIILTHPLQEWSLLMRLFDQDEDRLGHLWIAGLPEQYSLENQEAFRSWLVEKQLKGTRLHFLAVESLNGGSVFVPAYRRYLEPWYTEEIKEGEDAFNLGDIKISLLGVNPTHFRGRGPKVLGIENEQNYLKGSFPEDTNSDSLVIKITHGLSSVILAGNATSLTTNRILNNYLNSPKAVQATVLVASQYGSSDQGANHSPWIQAVKPRCILMNQGEQATLNQVTYETFLDSPFIIKNFTPHEVKIQRPEFESYETTHGVFSTLTSGTLTLELYKKRFTLKTQKDGQISSFQSVERKEVIEEKKDPTLKRSQPGIKQDRVVPSRPMERSHSVNTSPVVKRHIKTKEVATTSQPRSTPSSPEIQRSRTKRTKSVASSPKKILNSSQREKSDKNTSRITKEKLSSKNKELEINLSDLSQYSSSEHSRSFPY